MKNLFEKIYRESVYENTEESLELRELFDEYNDKYFNGNLYINKICWANRRTTQRLGAYFPSLLYIVLNPILKDHTTEPIFKDVLVHEMVHCELDGMDSGHGTLFLRRADELNNKYGLKITATADDGSDLSKLLNEYRAEKEAKRNEKLNNISNKPELQAIYDMLNKEYFDNKLTTELVLEFLPKKTWNLYNLGQQRRNDDEWIWYIKVNRDKIEQSLMNAMLYIYCYDIIKPSKKEMNKTFENLRNEYAEKYNLEYLKSE